MRAALVVAVLLHATPAAALEVRISGIGMSAVRVVAALELSDLLRDRFLELVEQGRTIFVQVEAELWEDRRLADRLALTPVPLTWRIDRAREGGVLLTDQFGNRTVHDDPETPLPVRVDLGPSDALADDNGYYVRAEVTVATVADAEIERTGAAIFGDRQSAEGLAGLGRFIFNTLLRIGRYLESERATVTSDRVTGRQIRAAAN